MEASSHGLDQHRLDGVRLAAGAFTNLGRDHMDYHPTVEAYFDAKMRLFRELLPKGAPAVIFADDAWSGRAIAAAREAGLDVRTVGRQGDFLCLKRAEHERFRQNAEIEADGAFHEIRLPLAGDFQISNALVAAGLAIVHRHAGRRGARRARASEGRLRAGWNWSARPAHGAPVYVDYAHKPEALENVLSSVGRSPPAASSSCSAAAATATGASARSWARSPAGWPTWSSSPTTTRAARSRPRSAPRSWRPRPARSRSATGARRSAPPSACSNRATRWSSPARDMRKARRSAAATLHFSDHEEARAALRGEAA